MRQITWVCREFPNGDLSRRRDNLSFSHHLEVAGLEKPAEQDRWLDLAEGNGWTREELRAALREARRGGRLEAMGQASGRYGVILADPPWRYEFSEPKSRKIENQYPTMALDAICDVEVQGRRIEELAGDDSLLYLWAPPPQVEEALLVLEAWGFRYATSMVWVKDRIGMGYWARQRHEAVLIGTRGAPPTPALADRPDSVIEAPRGRHSEKPAVVHELIERRWPGAPRIELFARSRREGWDFWGNQVSGSEHRASAAGLTHTTGT